MAKSTPEIDHTTIIGHITRLRRWAEEATIAPRPGAQAGRSQAVKYPTILIQQGMMPDLS